MKLNRTELKKIIYEFNVSSNRLLQADFNDYNSVLSKYISFLTKTEIIYEYIKDCGTCDQDMEKEFQEVRTLRAIFDLGETTEEEVKNVFAILKYIVDNNVNVHYGIGMSYSHNKKFQNILKDFNSRVTMVLIRHIETYLTKVGIDMGLEDNVTYNITFKDGQLNIANDTATINATNSVSGINFDELTPLLDEILITSEKSDLSPEDKDTVSSSLEVIGEELKVEKPRKAFLKTAIAGLQAIKGTAEFGAAVVALIQFVQPLIR